MKILSILMVLLISSSSARKDSKVLKVNTYGQDKGKNMDGPSFFCEDYTCYEPIYTRINHLEVQINKSTGQMVPKKTTSRDSLTHYYVIDLRKKRLFKFDKDQIFVGESDLSQKEGGVIFGGELPVIAPYIDRFVLEGDTTLHSRKQKKLQCKILKDSVILTVTIDPKFYNDIHFRPYSPTLSEKFKGICTSITIRNNKSSANQSFAIEECKDPADIKEFNKLKAMYKSIKN